MKRVIVVNSKNEEINNICSMIAESHENILPFSPAHMFSFLNEDDNEKKLSYCLNLINDCDELWVFGNEKNDEDTQKMVNMAQLLNKTIRYWDKIK